MPTMEQARALRTATQDYVTLGIYEAQEMLRSLAGEAPDTIAGALADLLPEVVSPYATGISDLTTDFYLADRSAQGVRGRYTPTPGAGVPERQRLTSLARWAAAPLFPKEAAAVALLQPVFDAALDSDPMTQVRNRLIGGVTGLLGSTQRDGTGQLALGDPEQGTRYQRLAMPGACAFCAMLASRGGVYRSAESATGVVGRGMPMTHTIIGVTEHGHEIRKRGGQAKGIKPRGTREIGDSYHDHCKCIGVALHKDNEMVLDSAAAAHYAAYADALRKIQNADGATELSAAERTDRVLAEMRTSLGVH